MRSTGKAGTSAQPPERRDTRYETGTSARRPDRPLAAQGFHVESVAAKGCGQHGRTAPEKAGRVADPNPYRSVGKSEVETQRSRPLRTHGRGPSHSLPQRMGEVPRTETRTTDDLHPRRSPHGPAQPHLPDAEGARMTPHTHPTYVEGCYRCDLSRDEPISLAERRQRVRDEQTDDAYREWLAKARAILADPSEVPHDS